MTLSTTVGPNGATVKTNEGSKAYEYENNLGYRHIRYEKR